MALGVNSIGNLQGVVNSNNALLVSVDGGLVTLTQDGIGVTSTDGLVLQNTTDAAAGAQQMSPRIRFHGEGWKTDATAASQTVDIINELLPVQGAAAPTANLLWKYSVNGGAYSTILTLTSAGNLTSAGALTAEGITSNSHIGIAGASLIFWTSRAVMASPANGQWNLTNNAQGAGVGLDVATDAVLKVRTRAQTGYASIQAGSTGIGVTSTDGLAILNGSAAAAGAQQMSPRVRFDGFGWKTDATAASQAVSVINELLPVEGASAPTANLLWKYSVNGGAYSTILTLTSTGVIFTGSSIVAGGAVAVNAVNQLGWDTRSEMTSPANGQINLTNNAESAGVGLDVATDAVLKVRTRAQTGNAAVTASQFFPIRTVSLITTDGNVTYSAAQVLGGVITRSGIAANRVDAFPTAADLVAGIAGAAVGLSFELVINNNDDASTITVNGASTGITYEGAATALAAGDAWAFLCVLTNITGAAEAATVYQLAK